MIEKIKQFFHLVSRSHRWLHILCGFLVGLFFGFGAAICVGIALEGKDVQHDRTNFYRLFIEWTWKAWDWVDFACTVAGGLVGSLIRLWVIGRFM